MSDPQRPTWHLVGGRGALPTLDELIDFSRRLTGCEPTAAEIEEARQTLAAVDDDEEQEQGTNGPC